MSESSEYTADSSVTTPAVTTTEPVVVAESRPNRLSQAAAWVGIVAGTLFIVAVIFFTGFILGKDSGGSGHFGRHGGQHGMMMDRQGPGMHHRGGPDGEPGGRGGPGMMRPNGPDRDAPAPPPPAQSPSTPPTR